MKTCACEICFQWVKMVDTYGYMAIWFWDFPISGSIFRQTQSSFSVPQVSQMYVSYILILYLLGGLEHFFIFSIYSIGNVIIPTDFHIFQMGGSTTNQYINIISHMLHGICINIFYFFHTSYIYIYIASKRKHRFCAISVKKTG